MDAASEVNPYIDNSAGALVWVRRRNGSWWPGRILGPEELPGSHLLSPRTGTPVKLLGREDGSVDWYNIEKSRRVKAFRCGDFDECIERAKSLASVLTKKREKYARREDAILHALELEKKYIEQNYLLERSFAVDCNYKHMPSFADDDMVLDDDMDGMANHSDFHSDFMDPESSADATQASLDSLFSLQGDKKFLDADWEDDITDTLPRMRALQDFGLKIASSKERKANWSASYEHNPHISFAEDEQKMTSCITRNTAPCAPPVSSKTSCAMGAILKRKRSSQAGCMEDETGLKKKDRRKQSNVTLENSVKLADGMTDLASKASVSYFIPSMARNGSTLVHPKQENNAMLLVNDFQGSSEMKPLTSTCGPEFWPASHIDTNMRTRHELIDPLPVMDKACSSFSDHIKSNCCEGRQYPFVDCQMETAALTGSAFADPFGHGISGSRCSLFPRSLYPGSLAGVSENGFQKTGSFLAQESLCSPLANFSSWPYCGGGPREMIYEKFGHEMGLRGPAVSSRAAGFPEYSFENNIANTGLPMYSLYNNPLEDHSTFAKNNTGDRDSALLLTKCVTKVDVLESPKQCLSAIADGDGETDEDDADSFQPPQDHITSSPDATEFHDTPGLMKPTQASDGFCDTRGYHELKGVTRNGFVSMDEQWNERPVDQNDIHGNTSKNKVLSDCNGVVAAPTITKWQAKGRRGVRVGCSNSWVSPAAGMALRGVVLGPTIPDTSEGMHEDCVFIPWKKRTSRGSRYSFNIDTSSEEEPLKGKVSSGSHQQSADPSHMAQTNRLHVGSMQSFAASDVSNPPWFEITVEEDKAMNASCFEHVPQVSIMSMLKGRPIVGYAVHVDIVDRKYRTNQGSSAIRSHSTGNAIRKPHPVWRTGRRTAMQRIPRSCSMVALRDGEPEKQLQSKHCAIQNREPRKSGYMICSSAEKKKSSKKPGLPPQKTRMLSSIAGQDESEHDNTRNPPAPLETCIPVNVIFNRIREVLYRGLNNAASDFDNVS